MIAPDERVRCRCGRSTFPVRDSDALRTCSKCGYLTSYCTCKRLGPVSALGSLKIPSLSDRTRTVLGTAMVSSLGTLFFVTLLSSPLLGVFGFGIPFGLNAAFFGKWLKEQRPVVATPGLLTVLQSQDSRVQQR